MRYLIFNTLLIMLIIVCLFKPYIVNERFVDIEPNKVGFNVNLEPVEIKIIYTPNKTQVVEPSEEIFPTQYSPPFIQQKIIAPEPPSPEPIPEVKPVITVKNIMSCKTQLNNRITEINKIKSKDMNDAEELLLNRQVYDQRIQAQNDEIIKGFKEEANISNRKYIDQLGVLNDVKNQNKECQKRVQSFNFNFEQLRNCCSTETQRALQISQILYEKCTVDPFNPLVNKLQLVGKISTLIDQIKSAKDQISQIQSNNENLNTQIDKCNKDIISIQKKIQNCN